MRVLTRVAATAATAVLALTALTAPAVAAPPNDGAYHGRCFLLVTTDSTQVANPPNTWTGYAGAAMAFHAPTLGHNPAAGDVWCEVTVSGAFATGVNDSAPLAVGFAQPVTFTAGPNDPIGLCTLVKVTDAHGGVAGYGTCSAAVVLDVTLPDPNVTALATGICAAINDYTLCNLLAANSGRVLLVT